MEHPTKSTIKLGLFVSITVCVFLVAIYFIGKKQQMFGQTFRLSAMFSDVSGLQVGNNVRLAGITVGIVDDLQQINDTLVQVDMLINKDSQPFIKSNSRALVGSDGLMGNKIILISSGSPNKKPVLNNAIIQTTKPVDLDQIIENLELTSNNAAAITNDLALITKQISQGKGTLGRLLMDSVMADGINQTIVNIKNGAGGFDQNMKAASKSVFLRRLIKKKKAQ